MIHAPYLSTLFAYIFWPYRVPYLMFEIEIIEYMDCGTKEFIHKTNRLPYLIVKFEILGNSICYAEQAI